MTIPLPPHDIESEQGLIASCLLDHDAISVITGSITSRDFYHGAHGLLYDVIDDLFSRREPADLLLVYAELERRKIVEPSGGMPYLVQLMAMGSASSNYVEYYRDIVVDRSIKRQIIDAGAKIVTIGYDNGLKAREVLERSHAFLDTITHDEGQQIGFRYDEALDAFTQEVEDRWEQGPSFVGARHYRTGFRDLDKALGGGLYPGEVTVVAGRPGSGKTMFMLQVAHNIARRELHQFEDPHWTLIFSSEMTMRSLLWRGIAEVAEISAEQIKAGVGLTDVQRDTIRKRIAYMRTMPVWIDDTSQPTTDQIRQRVERFAADRPVGVVMFDYLQQAGNKGKAGKFGNNEQRVAEVSLALKHLAKSANVSVVPVAQLNRALETRADKHPMMADLRDSGQIEQDADRILFLYRQDYYEDQGIIKPGDAAYNTGMVGMCELELAKNREGATGKFMTRFLPEIAAFRDDDR